MVARRLGSGSREFTADQRAALLKLLGSDELVNAVRIECLTWEMAGVTDKESPARIDLKTVRDELAKLDKRISTILKDLRQVSDNVWGRIQYEAHELRSNEPLQSSISNLSELRNCVKAAETRIDVPKSRPKNGREHLLISMILRVLPELPRRAGGNSKLPRVLAIVYGFVGIQLNPQDALQRPRDHLKSYFKDWGTSL